jgi:hypothetical protein
VTRNPRRRPQLVEHEGKRQTLEQWAGEAGIKTATLYARLRKGWPMSATLSRLDLRRRDSYVAPH